MLGYHLKALGPSPSMEKKKGRGNIKKVPCITIDHLYNSYSSVQNNNKTGLFPSWQRRSYQYI